MKYFEKISLFLKQHLLIVIPLTVIIGIAAGYTFDLTFLRRWTIPFTILIVYPMMIGLPLRSIASLTDTRVLVYTQVVNFAIIPFIGYGLILVFFQEHLSSLEVGFLLVALLPTSGGMTISWTGLANGNIQAAIKMTVIGLLLGATCAPFYLKLLMNKTIPIPFSQVGYAILMIVGLPLLLGQLTRMLLVKHVGEQVFTTRIKPLLPACSTWGLIGLIFTAIALKARVFVKAPSLIIQIAVPLILFYLFTYLVARPYRKILFTSRRCNCAGIWDCFAKLIDCPCVVNDCLWRTRSRNRTPCGARLYHTDPDGDLVCQALEDDLPKQKRGTIMREASMNDEI